MNTDVIDAAFRDMISQRGIYRKLGITAGNVRNIRYNLNNAIPVSTDLKLKLLQKSGWRQDDKTYSRSDMVSLLRFYQRTSQTARDMGEEYVIEKWEQSQKH